MFDLKKAALIFLALVASLPLTEAGAEEIGRKPVSTLLPEVRDSLARRAPVLSGGMK